MRRCGLLGETLAHSFSPLIHAELGDYEYRLYETPARELETFLRSGNFDGLNVTIPYKKAVIPFCAELSKTARLTGSVNTLTRRGDGSLLGHNTDFFGFRYLLERAGINPGEGKTVVLGNGGSSLTVTAVLRELGAREVAVVSRSGADNYENLEKHREAKWLINTTPVGMYPNNGLSPIADPGVFSGCRAVVDLIYNPARTELMLRAEENRIPTVGGLVMLAAQAKRSAELFTGGPIPDGRIEGVASKIARLSRNIVLIGMPGCGKTSIGAALAAKTGREFADTDELIAQAAGKPIPAIFADDGEEAFRKMESHILGRLCKRSGLVIATGGGVVTRGENRRVLRQNGLIIFLERDIGLLPVAGRPLSQQEGPEALAAVRLPLYRQWGEYAAPVRGIEETAADIQELISRVWESRAYA